MKASQRPTLGASLLRPAVRIFGTGGVAFFLLALFGIVVFLVFAFVNHH
jgi:hypothetical protein